MRGERNVQPPSNFWHCPRVVQLSGVRPLSLVRPSVCLSHPAAARRRCRFAAVGQAGRRSIAAAAEGECGQCHVVSVRSS